MQRRHSWRSLALRTLLGAAGTVGVGLGLYPLAPQFGLALLRTRGKRPQPKKLVRAVAAEWAFASVLQVARPVGLFGLPMIARKARGPRPVVLLHGFLMGRANFLLLAQRLASAGIGPLEGFEYWTLGRIRRAAIRLGAFVDELCEQTGADRVDLIGHSMGGMVARYYATLGGGGRRVRNLITVGSPHNGTAVSAFGLGWPAVELAAGSRLVDELATAPLPEGVRATAIWSRADGLVSSRREAGFPGAEELVYEDLGHLSLLASRRVAREIISRLKMP